MSVPPEYFARIAGNVNLPLLQSRLVIVVGVGTVGSQIAQELAKCGIGHFVLMDHDTLEETNLIRHALPREYLGQNKAQAMTLYLADQVPGLCPTALPHKGDEFASDGTFDNLLKGTDLIVAANDDREAQRRLGRRALALSIPAIFPALYGDDGGEVIVQLDPRLPCFFCWDGFRTNEERLRGVAALNVATFPVIHAAIRLSLGILDPRSEHRRMMRWAPNEPPRQVFTQEGFSALDMGTLTRRPNCPSCAVGPAPSVGDSPPSTPTPPRWTYPGIPRGVTSKPSPGAPPPTTPPPQWPTPGTLPSRRPQPRPTPSTPQPHPSPDLGGRTIAIVIALAVIGIVAITSIASSMTPRGLSRTPQQIAARKATAEKQILQARLEELRLMCITGSVCKTDPVDHAAPIFIYGMDNNLRLYLEAHGYTDSWSDNAGFVTGDALHPRNEGAEISYVKYRIGEIPTGPESEERLRDEPPTESGLIYTPWRKDLSENAERGLLPAGGVRGHEWVITWRLKAPSGHIVKESRYSLTVMSCPDSNPENNPCAPLVMEQKQLENEWATETYNKYYTPPPPQLFPYT